MLYDQGAGTKQTLDNAEYEYNTALSNLHGSQAHHSQSCRCYGTRLRQSDL
jgi:hypothetical protein